MIESSASTSEALSRRIKSRARGAARLDVAGNGGGRIAAASCASYYGRHDGVPGFLRSFGSEVLPTGPALAGLMGRLEFTVQGYDDHPEEIYAIEEVRAFYGELWSSGHIGSFSAICDQKG